ncbi:hypothetical protein B0T26DRAFT_868802 [Lasiosphaeria miniovina]|uniref:Uncharacterized protein n=1 Tax=Lasiosphaeria miniovina TaxID=1954250 RepID=A0AA40B4M9_9PEZI|nr:uncharacterized protein B0T26DRAFT_868802 [Lasiosphaeria miniovina]KAK0727524.1 hypothetical protein B0T26DRAFT_868802 [Lasiosphaeria miniovina]
MSQSVLLPPFLSNDPMEGDPPCSWSDFLEPKLRCFPRPDDAKLPHLECLGNGIEGLVAKLQFDDGGQVFALKIFFDSEPIDQSSMEARVKTIWSLEREARTVAILEKVCAGLRQSSPLPINVLAHKRSPDDAIEYLPSLLKGDGIESSTRCPGIRESRAAEIAYLNRSAAIPGWDRKDYRDHRGSLEFHREAGHFALVYEYIPAAKTEMDPVKRQLDFFSQIGFGRCQPMNPCNWQGPGFLIDFGDYNTPIDEWFSKINYRAHREDPEAIVDPTAYDRRMDELWEAEKERNGGKGDLLTDDDGQKISHTWMPPKQSPGN